MRTVEEIKKQIKAIEWFIDGHKKQVDHFLSDDDFDVDKACEYGRKIHFEKIDKELLQHRRENNIFEVGDVICCDNFENLLIVANVVDDVLVIDTGIKTTPDSKNTMAMALPMGMFRHATDAEIKAGHRL